MGYASESDEYKKLGGMHVLITASSVEQAGLVVGRTYEYCAIGGMALVRNDTTAATIADGGFDFAVPNGGCIRVVANDTLVNVIEADASSTATAVLTISEVKE